MINDDVCIYILRFLDFQTLLRVRRLSRRHRWLVDTVKAIEGRVLKAPWVAEFHFTPHPITQKPYADGILIIGSKKYKRECEGCDHKRCCSVSFKGKGLPSHALAKTCLAKLNLYRGTVDFLPYKPGQDDRAICDVKVRWEGIK